MYSDCQGNIKEIIERLMSLGFVIHPVESVVFTTQYLTHIRFCLDLDSMKIALPTNKAQRVQTTCHTLASQSQALIHQVARVIGLLVSSFPAVPLGKLHYHQLEADKIQGLRLHRGNFDAHMSLLPLALQEFAWWQANVCHQSWPLLLSPITRTICSDASDYGWGAIIEGTDHTCSHPMRLSCR